MPNKQYYVLKDAKTEPPVMDTGFVLSAPFHLELPYGPKCVGRFHKLFKEWRHDGNKIEPSSYLTPCTEPLFTMEEVDEIVEALNLSQAEIRAMYKRLGLKNSNVLDIIDSILDQYNKDKQQFLEQLKQSK